MGGGKGKRGQYRGQKSLKEQDRGGGMQQRVARGGDERIGKGRTLKSRIVWTL